MAKRPSLTPLPELLTRLLKSHGMASHMLEYTLQQRWPELVGEHIGRHTRPESIRHRKLYLVAENSVWLQQLRFLKSDLLAKVNAATEGDALTDIILRVGEVAASDATGAPVESPVASPAKPALTAAQRAAIDMAVQPVTDPDLEARLRALFQYSAP